MVWMIFLSLLLFGSFVRPLVWRRVGREFSAAICWWIGNRVEDHMRMSSLPPSFSEQGGTESLRKSQSASAFARKLFGTHQKCMQTPNSMVINKRFGFVVRVLHKGHEIDHILPPKVLQGNHTDVVAERHLHSKKKALC